MKRERTPEEIERSGYVSKAEIKRFFGYGDRVTANIYKSAELIDLNELGKDRPIISRVRLKSVYKALGIKGRCALRK